MINKNKNNDINNNNVNKEMWVICFISRMWYVRDTLVRQNIRVSPCNQEAAVLWQ